MSLLRRASVALVLSCAFLVHRAQAQVSAYGTIATTDYGYGYNGDGDNFYGDYFGFGGGLTYDFAHAGSTVFGVDLRDTYTPDKYYGGNVFAASFHVRFVSDAHPCHPYVQIGPGYISAKVPQQSFSVGPTTINTAAVSVGGGLDVRVSPNVDIRAIEIESSAGGNGARSAATASFSTGVVYHFHVAKRQKP